MTELENIATDTRTWTDLREALEKETQRNEKLQDTLNRRTEHNSLLLNQRDALAMTLNRLASENSDDEAVLSALSDVADVSGIELKVPRTINVTVSVTLTVDLDIGQTPDTSEVDGWLDITGLHPCEVDGWTIENMEEV